MFSQQSSRVLATCQCHFKPLIDIATRLPPALKQAIARESDFKMWSVNIAKASFRNPETGIVMVLDNKVVQLQSLSIAYFRDNIELVSDLYKRMLHALDVGDAELFRFESIWYASVGMSHAEILELGLKAFGPPKNASSYLVGVPNDFYFRFHGKLENHRVITHIVPMASHDVESQLREIPNLELFRNDDKFDSNLFDLRSRLMEDCCCVIVEVFQDKKAVSGFERFCVDAMKITEQVSDNAINLIKALEARPLND